jgi:hypothetical protein
MMLMIAGALLALLPARETPAHRQQESPWNGDWVLSRTRNTKEVMESAA